jgi:hypothetical protein
MATMLILMSLPPLVTMLLPLPLPPVRTLAVDAAATMSNNAATDDTQMTLLLVTWAINKDG